MTQNSVAVVIPTYNEVDNLPTVVEQLLSLPEIKINIIVVDDGSPDGTGRVADELAELHRGKFQVIHRHGKLGLGTAYVEGFKKALAGDSEYIVQMDADLSHPTNLIPAMVDSLNEFDVAVASRYVEGGGLDPKWRFLRRQISYWGGFGIRIVLGLSVKDPTSGFKVFRRTALEAIDPGRLTMTGFGFQPEVAYRCKQSDLNVVEHPFTFMDRYAGDSKMSLGIMIEAFFRLTKLRLLGPA